MKTKQLIPMAFMACGFALFSSCADELSNIAHEEPTKEITGSWKVIKLTRNGEDLSQRLNLNDFRIEFKEDGTYTIAERLPFVLEGSGAYALSDPQYPFSVLMTAEGTDEEVPVNFQYPVVKGKRQLNLTFSLGCSSTTYQYSFERENQ